MRPLTSKWTLALLLGALCVTRPAFADDAPKVREPTAGDLASARNALREGLALREKNDTEGALTRLQSAWDFVPTPITGFELGKTHLMLGHVLQAHELFAKVGRIPPSMEESPRSQSARDEAARLMREVAPRIPSLRIKITLPPNTPATADVKIDDEKVTLSGSETTRLVEVGPHEVVAKAGDGPEQTVRVDVAESEVKEVQLTPQWVPPAPKPVVGASGQAFYIRQTNPLTFVGFGIAAAGIVATTIGAVIYFNAIEDAEDRCGDNYCPPSNTFGLPDNAIFDRQFDSARARYQLSAALMIAGGITTVVFGGIGAVFAARPIKERVTASPPRTFSPTIRVGGAGLQGTF